MDDHKSEYNGLRKPESKLRCDVTIATSSQNVGKPQETRTRSNADALLPFFEADTKRHLVNSVQNAWNSLKDNLARQSSVFGRYEMFYKLTMTIQLAGAAILPLKVNHNGS